MIKNEKSMSIFQISSGDSVKIQDGGNRQLLIREQNDGEIWSFSPF